MRYYPVGLDIEGRRCVVVGGGRVGERKALRLVECGGSVSVVSRKVTGRLTALADGGRIAHVREDYRGKHLEGAFLVIGATDDPDVNDRIYRDARRRGVLANIVDDPARCDFVLPALCQSGDLVITVATGGMSPALSKRLRAELEGRYGPEYGILLKIMGNVRRQIVERGRGAGENRKVFTSLVESDILQSIRRGHWNKVKSTLKRIAGVELDIEAYSRTAPGRRSGKKRLSHG